jgi:hypothetical protein
MIERNTASGKNSATPIITISGSTSGIAFLIAFNMTFLLVSALPFSRLAAYAAGVAVSFQPSNRL